MTIEEAFRAQLIADEDVAAIVDARVYTLILEQSATFPAIRIQLVSEIELMTLRGDLTNLFAARLQVDAWAAYDGSDDPNAAARALGRAVHWALMRAPFSAGSSPIEIEVTSTQLADRGVDYVADEQKLVRVRQDYIAIYHEIAS